MNELYGIVFPAVPHPHFDWHLELPPRWGVLDLRPKYRDSSIKQLVQDYYAPFSIEEEGKNRAAQFLTQAATSLLESHSLLALVLPTVNSEQKLSTCIISVRWILTATSYAELKNITDILASEHVNYEIKTTPRKVAYILYSRSTDTVFQNEAIMPVAGSNWMIAVASLTNDLELSETLRGVIIQIIESAKFHPHHSDSSW